MAFLVSRWCVCYDGLIMKTFLLFLELFIGLALIGAILLHSPKGEGLGAIGGGARLYSNPQSDMESGLDKVTYVLAALFLGIATILGLFL